MGIPLITVLKDAGWSEEDLMAMEKDQEVMDKAKQTVAQSVLNSLRIKQQQTNAVNPTAQDNTDMTGDNATA